MMSNDFEEAFDRYLETGAYDEASNVLFTVARNAFLAGWKAAGGEPPTPCRLFDELPMAVADDLVQLLQFQRRIEPLVQQVQNGVHRRSSPLSRDDTTGAAE